MSLNPEMGFNQTEQMEDLEMNIDLIQDASAHSDNRMNNEERKDQPETAVMNKEENKPETFELDIVNKHECMKNLKRTLDRMQEIFSP